MAVAPVSVTLATTALAPLGTPPLPVTCTVRVPPEARVLPLQGVAFALLVSQMRDGGSGAKYPDVVDE